MCLCYPQYFEPFFGYIFCRNKQEQSRVEVEFPSLEPARQSFNEGFNANNARSGLVQVDDLLASVQEAKKEQIAEDKKDLASTIQVKAEDENLLKNLDVECEEKMLSFEEKQKLRADEIEAIGKATEILAGDDVSGNAAEHLGLVQTGSSFVQFMSRSNNEGIHRKIREYLLSESQRLHSKNLNLLAEKIAADPFAKVKKLIDDMITRLLEEANADAEKEGWCDT